MISKEGSTQTADEESFLTDTLNTNDWINKQSKDEDVHLFLCFMGSERTPVSGRKSLRNRNLIYRNDSLDPEIIQIKTKTIRANQNYSDNSSSSSDTNEHD